MFVGFVVAIAWQYRVGLKRRRHTEQVAMAKEALARLRRDWTELPVRGPRPSASALAADLDLFGHASLQQLLNTPASPSGQQTLAAWLQTPAPPAAILARQAAVAELAAQPAWRAELELRGRIGELNQAHYERLVEWASDRQPNAIPRWLPIVALILALFTVIGGLAQISGLTSLPLGTIGLALNIIVTMLTSWRAEKIISRASLGRAAIESYAELFAHIAALPAQAEILRELQAKLRFEGQPAERQMARLGVWLSLGEMRQSPIYLALQLILLWNVQIADRLERWRLTVGPQTVDWLQTLGDYEALSALAGLAHDNPAWQYPHVSADAEPIFHAEGLGHPLLPSDRAVSNEVQLGPPGSFLFITGSNMAGKSTLLRSIGLNVVLAQAGAPVCAQVLRMPPLQMATSMRVQDSLESGVSYFMAELQRLREVVTLAEEAQAQGGPLVLFLLDEILHGTNSVERQIAARRIIRRLLDDGAIGAVSSHDLTLADGDELRSAAVAVHLRETIEATADGPLMRFDYRLRPGIATSSNALRLLALVGLDDKITISSQ